MKVKMVCIPLFLGVIFVPMLSHGAFLPEWAQVVAAVGKKTINSVECWNSRYSGGKTNYDRCMDKARSNYASEVKRFCGSSAPGPGLHLPRKATSVALRCDSIAAQNASRGNFDSSDQARYSVPLGRVSPSVLYNPKQYDVRSVKGGNAAMRKTRPLEITSEETAEYFSAVQSARSPFHDYMVAQQKAASAGDDSSSIFTLDNLALGLQVASALLQGVSDIQAAREQRKSSVSGKSRSSNQASSAGSVPRSIASNPGTRKNSKAYQDWSKSKGGVMNQTPNEIKGKDKAGICGYGSSIRCEGCKLQADYAKAERELSACNCAGTPRHPILFEKMRNIDRRKAAKWDEWFRHTSSCASCRLANLPISDFCDRGPGRHAPCGFGN